MKTKIVNVLCISGMVVSWSTYYLISKWAVEYTSSAFLAGMLLRLAALLFLTVYLFAKKGFGKLFIIEAKMLACKGIFAKLSIRYNTPPLAAEHAKAGVQGLPCGIIPFIWGKTTYLLLAIGLLGYLLDTFANVGFSQSSVGTGTVLLKTDILMANIAAAVIFKEKLFVSDWIGTVVMLVGVLLVLNIDYNSFRFNWYDIFFILSALSVTANAFIIKGVQDKKNVDSDTIAYYNNFVVLVLFVVSSLIAGDFGKLGAIKADATFFGLVLAGGLAQSLIYIFYYRNLKHFAVWKVKLFLLFVPIISCFVGVFAFGEKLVALQFAGIALVVLGSVAILLRNKINNNPKESTQ